MSEETWGLIKSAFVASKKTIKAVAKEAKVDERTFRKVINQGYRNIRSDTEAALLEYFGIVLMPVYKESLIIMPQRYEDYKFWVEHFEINERSNYIRFKSYLKSMEDSFNDIDDSEEL